MFRVISFHIPTEQKTILKDGYRTQSAAWCDIATDLEFEEGDNPEEWIIAVEPYDAENEFGEPYEDDDYEEPGYDLDCGFDPFMGQYTEDC